MYYWAKKELTAQSGCVVVTQFQPTIKRIWRKSKHWYSHNSIGYPAFVHKVVRCECMKHFDLHCRSKWSKNTNIIVTRQSIHLVPVPFFDLVHQTFCHESWHFFLLYLFFFFFFGPQGPQFPTPILAAQFLILELLTNNYFNNQICQLFLFTWWILVKIVLSKLSSLFKCKNRTHFCRKCTQKNIVIQFVVRAAY